MTTNIEVDSYRINKLEETVQWQSKQIDVVLETIDRVEDKLKSMEIEKNVKKEIRGLLKSIFSYVNMLSPFILLIITVISSLDMQKLSTVMKNSDYKVVVQNDKNVSH